MPLSLVPLVFTESRQCGGLRPSDGHDRRWVPLSLARWDHDSKVTFTIVFLMFFNLELRAEYVNLSDA